MDNFFVVILVALTGAVQFSLEQNMRSNINTDTDVKGPQFVKTRFWLYTKESRETGQEIFVNDDESVINSNFDAKNPTRFFIHGWSDRATSISAVQIRSSYLDRQDYNIFTVDWNNNGKSTNYVMGRINVNETGQQVADFIGFMEENHGLNLNATFLIGHNLGAHIAGIAAKGFKNKDVPINTIFGLDPALPLFSINDPESRLAIGDAKFVETIHTNGGQIGFQAPIGDAAFYPNWGRRQPACFYESDGTCSDQLVTSYFAESLDERYEYLGKECGSYDNIRDEKCPTAGTAHKLVKMGGDLVDNTIAGVYYVPVDEKYPYVVTNKTWIDNLVK
ncbi:unnamed protein product [Hermetia illucens]|uniref:Lipase domain-containing protein n=1 Tax=Hermetia illucens TaxID=343691 RepID=A0A7R8YN60_HERIL|nr:phospholipase A1-like [Hermetia illucens]CAD7079341.1 unnamed protein product [Hermetia illucens]